ncbi:hypothetical protein VPNG_09365 [Cytospora leucostoma]|uniref:DUF676 domain-containing protein n=1 Tax=Cytospora leucostoma TaxID=1230097 RepID=A0A423VT66_9PEZI|nr:hypothetical protein VPNG_09365 [Cytospora leucostoma]
MGDIEGPRADDVAHAESRAPIEVSGARGDAGLDNDPEDTPERIQSAPLPPRPSSYPGHEGQDHQSDDAPSSTTGLLSLRQRQLASTHDSDHAASNRTSMSHWDPEPGFAHVDGEIGGSGYNETLVDIVTVPCPGADPVETWTRDPLPDGFFGNPSDNESTSYPTLKELAGDAILTPGISGNFPKAAHLWVRQGIRRYANTARVLLYRHRELTELTTLDELARDLLDNVLQRREGLSASRPVFFIAHSIGGLVVKQALLKAGHDEKYREILLNCHGVTFFATPHRGSSHMSRRHLSESIQRLLHLQRPLPKTLAQVVRVGSKDLLKMHDEFTDIASEMRLWTFYETIDSELSGSGYGTATEVEFRAPLVSIKSAIVGVRQETIYSSLQSDHAHCASFGITNPHTMSTYLHDLANAVAKAEILSRTTHTPLRLKEQVKIELVGFYEDPDTDLQSDIRLYFTRHHLAEFLKQGPERCLEERLRGVPRRRGAPGHRSSAQAVATSGGHGGLNILDNMQELRDSAGPGSHERQRPSSPPIIVAEPSMTEEHELPQAVGRRPHSLTLPNLSSPGFRRPSTRGSGGTVSTASDPTGGELSPKEGASDTHRETRGHTSRAGADSGRTELYTATKSHEERFSPSSILQELVAGFSRPEPARRKFMWIHLPFTNPLWVKDIFDKLSETHNQNFSKLFNNENWVSRHVHGRHSQSQPSFVKPAVHFIPPDSAPSPRPSSNSSPKLGNTGPPTSYLYLYLPYLHFDTYRQIIKRRNIMTRRLAHGRARPVPEDIARLDSLELRMIWEYLGYDPPLNCRRTLDQYGYPSLRNTYARDDDQMLYKLTKEDTPQRFSSAHTIREEEAFRSLAERYSQGTRLLHEVVEREKEASTSDSGDETEASELRDGNLLMVDQLWLWAVDATTLTTFFPKRESRPSEGALFQQADLRNSIYNELNGDLTGRCESALDLAAFVALHAVTVLLDRSSHPDLEVFRIFEEAIGMLTERMTSNLKKFRMQTFREVGLLDPGDDGGDPEDNSTKAIKRRHKREIEAAERENRENTSALMELRDMEDELKTLSKLFDTQAVVLGRMLDIYLGDGLRDLTLHGQGYLQEALGRLDEYKAQTTEMLDRVAATKGDKLLEMAQRQAQVDDVRWSRLQTELASSQNLSVMIFTIFTVIFLPLSFFTSLFGMNTVEWDAQLPTLGFIGEVSLPASAAVVLATLVAAFSSHVQVASGAAWRRALRGWRAAAGGLERLEPEASRRLKERRRAERAREERGERERRMKDMRYDFWATVRRQWTMGSYEIPDLNRERTGTGFDSSGSGAGTKPSTWKSDST